MSDKPKIYAFCDAGCKWETVHRDEFEQSAALIPMKRDGGVFRLEPLKTYRVRKTTDLADSNYGFLINLYYEYNGTKYTAKIYDPDNVPLTDALGQSYNFDAAYKEFLTIRLCDLNPMSGGRVAVIEFDGKLFYSIAATSGASDGEYGQYDNVELRVEDTTECYQVNEFAEIKVKVDASEVEERLEEVEYKVEEGLAGAEYDVACLEAEVENVFRNSRKYPYSEYRLGTVENNSSDEDKTVTLKNPKQYDFPVILTVDFGFVAKVTLCDENGTATENGGWFAYGETYTVGAGENFYISIQKKTPETVSKISEYAPAVTYAKEPAKSAYDYAKDGGYSGTEEEFAEDINPDNIKSEATPQKGVDYFDGEPGSQGEKGDTGADGKSAYAYAQDAGYTGTEEEFAKNLANAPEWVETEVATGDETVVISEQTLTSGIWSGLQREIQPDVAYAVRINNTVYSCIASNDGDGGIYLGNPTLYGITSMPHNDEPFCILWMGGSASQGMFIKDSSMSYPLTLKVTEVEKAIVYKLPEGYLPDCVVKSVNGTTPDESGNVEVDLPETPDLSGMVKSVNGTTPDENGNVEVEVPDVSSSVKPGLTVAIIGDSISTHPQKNVSEMVITSDDVGVELSSFVTYYDIDKTISLDGETSAYTITADDVGTELTFKPCSADVGKKLGTPLNYNSIKSVWWQVAADKLGFEPIAACWSGSSITSHTASSQEKAISYAWHDHTIRKLGKRVAGSMERIAPDVVLIYRGTNDLSHSAKVRLTDGYFDAVDWMYPESDALSDGATYGFKEGLALTIKKIRETYPRARIVLCTCNVFKRSNYSHFPTHNGYFSIPQMNNAIREVADFFGCHTIELDKCGITFENCYDEGYITDSATTPTHPNTSGHALMGQQAICDLVNKLHIFDIEPINPTTGSENEGTTNYIVDPWACWADGTEQALTGYFAYVDYPVEAGAVYSIPYGRNYFFEDSSHTYISGGAGGGSPTLQITVPENGAYITICFKPDEITTSEASITKVSSGSTDTGDSSGSGDGGTTTNYIVDPWACWDNGTESATSGYFSYVDYPVEGGATYSIPYGRNYFFEDSSHAYISGGSGGGSATLKITTPENAAYITICFKPDDISVSEATITKVTSTDSGSSDGGSEDGGETNGYLRENTAVNGNTGATYTATGYFSYVDYPVEAGATYSIPYGRNYGIFDESDNLVGAGGLAGASKATLAIPENGAYINICWSTADISTSDVAITNTRVAIGELSGTLNEGAYLATSSATTLTGVGSGGTTYFAYSDIAVEAETTYNAPYARNAAYYQADGTYISGGTGGGSAAGTLTTPAGAAFMTVTYKYADLAPADVTITKA